ncbi:MAG: Alanine-tRNA ligase [Parcubacteria group bacterium GW2011_GWA2_42_11]|nr:MAG: Alanine-tRNA ligase [Parcubacteria group bacterium GW2011_GWA2_42_11]KKT76777.1 MAG: Alanine-tRNA ligase [Parcubacteria group bacterium GW2011_GWF2_44_7]
MTAKELRDKFLKFMETKGHTIIPSASLIPENDPTVLFTTAGMHPLVPYLMGEKHPGGQRVANCQKCIRTTDIDEVGDATHHTFFEMLGNWSFGDYFKQEAIEWSWEFLTSSEWLNLDKKRLAVSVFAGDSDAPFDEEAFNIWKNLGVSEKRIARLPKKNNWWGPAGQTGPCGPDSEMFYWSGDADKVPESFNDDNVMWVEIWNDVFMQFNKNDQGQYEPLEQKNVDTGMGLERTLAVLNGLDDNYRTELFWPLIEKIEELSGKKYDGSEEVKKAMRIIADHIKAAVFLIADGVISSNTGRGYVLRKIIRRAMHYMGILSIKKGSLAGPADIVIKQYGDIYENLKNNIEKIKKEIIEEEYKVEKSIEEGLKAFRVVDKNKPKGEPITGEEAAYLYQTHSLSFDNTKGLAREYGRGVTDNFYEIAEEKTKEHQVLSRTASAGMFKGGLADASEETKKLHTAAHLMLAALRQVLGEHVYQKGSNITAERLRFDFSHPQKMTPEEIKKVEEIVNEKIAAKLPVVCEELSLDEAKAKGAMGVFEQKYGERVKIYGISGFSKEICGGPHVENTGELGKFKIKKEEASSAGVRRIKAVLE